MGKYKSSKYSNNITYTSKDKRLHFTYGTMDTPKTTVITFGTFDLCHVGHVRVLKRASALGDRLVVGVSSDALNRAKKNKDAVYSEQERMEIIGSLRFVDETFLEESLEAKADYIKKYGATVLVMGDDWKGRFDDMPCKVVYLERTPSVSTTELVERIRM